MNYTQEVSLINQRLCLIVKSISNKYGFDYNEAIQYLSLQESIPDKKITEIKNQRKGSIPLPFCGVIFNHMCQGIKYNHGLYTQCQSKPTDGELCSVCKRNIIDGRNKGRISDRMNKGYLDPKGKKVVNYGHIMLKLGITREQADLAASDLGLIIPESEYEVIKNTRGRPKKIKEIIVSDTESDNTVKSNNSKKESGNN